MTFQDMELWLDEEEVNETARVVSPFDYCFDELLDVPNSYYLIHNDAIITSIALSEDWKLLRHCYNGPDHSNNSDIDIEMSIQQSYRHALDMLSLPSSEPLHLFIEKDVVSFITSTSSFGIVGEYTSLFRKLQIYLMDYLQNKYVIVYKNSPKRILDIIFHFIDNKRSSS